MDHFCDVLHCDITWQQHCKGKAKWKLYSFKDTSDQLSVCPDVEANHISHGDYAAGSSDLRHWKLALSIYGVTKTSIAGRYPGNVPGSIDLWLVCRQLRDLHRSFRIYTGTGKWGWCGVGCIDGCGRRNYGSE